MRYGLIGRSLPHTLSPEIHEAFGTRYGVTELANESEVARYLASREFCGINVTIPYKETVMPYLDRIDSLALDIGAVNTVINDNGKLIGYNTDIMGMRRAIEEAGIEIAGRRVLVLGSGGTSKTACFTLKRMGAESIDVVSRSGDIDYENVYERCRGAQVIVNTTPVGMMPESYASPIDINAFDSLEGVFDAVYNPLTTLMVQRARERGIPAANGMTMLVEQARLAHNLFAQVNGDCGGYSPESETERVTNEVFAGRRNIVLIGMAGGGKSVIGKRLAALLGREFADTDETVEREEGCSVSEIFERHGERYFREAEKKAVKTECMKLGKVIATGGGAVLDSESAFYIKSNAAVVWIDRDPALSATAGRPLSRDIGAVKRLYAEREPIYSALCDIRVKNDGSIEDAVKEIADRL